MESRVVNMTQELQKKGANYKKLEDQHFINVNLMKEAEERAKTEEEKRKKIEVELTEQKERVRKLESECIASIERARIEGIEEGKAEGKKLGHEGAMEEARTQFGFLLDAFKYGPPPHGGIAFGWDRVVMLLAGAETIREVIAFPKTRGGFDPLTSAPTPITAQQRLEAGIDAKPKAAAGAPGTDGQAVRVEHSN